MPTDDIDPMPTKQNRQRVRGVVKQLLEGDRVEVVTDTTRTLEVVDEPNRVEGEGRCPDRLLIELRANDTIYTIEVPGEQYDHPPTLHSPAIEKGVEVVRAITLTDDTEFAIVAGQTSIDLGIPIR